MPVVNVPGRGLVNFPDTMSQEEITAAIKKMTGGETAASVAAKPTTAPAEQPKFKAPPSIGGGPILSGLAALTKPVPAIRKGAGKLATKIEGVEREQGEPTSLVAGVKEAGRQIKERPVAGTLSAVGEFTGINSILRAGKGAFDLARDAAGWDPSALVAAVRGGGAGVVEGIGDMSPLDAFLLRAGLRARSQVRGQSARAARVAATEKPPADVSVVPTSELADTASQVSKALRENLEQPRDLGPTLRRDKAPRQSVSRPGGVGPTRLAGKPPSLEEAIGKALDEIRTQVELPEKVTLPPAEPAPMPRTGGKSGTGSTTAEPGGALGLGEDSAAAARRKLGQAARLKARAARDSEIDSLADQLSEKVARRLGVPAVEDSADAIARSRALKQGTYEEPVQLPLRRGESTLGPKLESTPEQRAAFQRGQAEGVSGGEIGTGTGKKLKQPLPKIPRKAKESAGFTKPGQVADTSPKPGMIRLWRGEHPSNDSPRARELHGEDRGRFFNSNRDIAEQFSEPNGPDWQTDKRPGTLMYIDLPAEEAAKYFDDYIPGQHILPKELADRARSSSSLIGRAEDIAQKVAPAQPRQPIPDDITQSVREELRTGVPVEQSAATAEIKVPRKPRTPTAMALRTGEPDVSPVAPFERPVIGEDLPELAQASTGPLSPSAQALINLLDEFSGQGLREILPYKTLGGVPPTPPGSFELSKGARSQIRFPEGTHAARQAARDPNVLAASLARQKYYRTVGPKERLKPQADIPTARSAADIPIAAPTSPAAQAARAIREARQKETVLERLARQKKGRQAAIEAKKQQAQAQAAQNSPLSQPVAQPAQAGPAGSFKEALQRRSTAPVSRTATRKNIQAAAAEGADTGPIGPPPPGVEQGLWESVNAVEREAKALLTDHGVTDLRLVEQMRQFWGVKEAARRLGIKPDMVMDLTEGVPKQRPISVVAREMDERFRYLMDDPHGFFRTEALVASTGAAAGALVGATIDGEDAMDRLSYAISGAILGGAIGWGGTKLANQIGQAARSGKIKRGIEAVDTANLLAGPAIIKASFGSMGGVAAGLWQRLREGKAAEVQRGLRYMRREMPKTWYKELTQSSAQLAKSNRYAQQVAGAAGAQGWPDRLLNNVLRPFIAADRAASKALSEMGFSKAEAERMMLMGEPTSWQGQTLLNLINSNMVFRMLAKFPRVRVGALERGIEFTPIASKKYGQAIRSTQSKVGRFQRQEGISKQALRARAEFGGAMMVAGTAYGYLQDPTLMEGSVVASAAGPAAIPAGMGIAAGKALKRGDATVEALMRAVESVTGSIPQVSESDIRMLPQRFKVLGPLQRALIQAGLMEAPE